MRELELRQHEIDAQSDQNSQADPAAQRRSFDVGRYLKLAPPAFHEDDVENYFEAFEKMADQMEWPVDKWSVILQSVLKGTSQKVYTAMSKEDSADYEKVKSKILDAYERVPEAYRQQFRGYVKGEKQTFCEFASEEVRIFDRWVRACKSEDEYGKLREVILLEEFLRKLSTEVRTYVTERKVNTLKEAATCADEYSLIHKTRCHAKPKAHPPPSGSKPQNGQTSPNPSGSPRPFRKTFSCPQSSKLLNPTPVLLVRIASDQVMSKASVGNYTVDQSLILSR